MYDDHALEPEPLLQRAVLRDRGAARIVRIRRGLHRRIVEMHMGIGRPGRDAEAHHAHFFFARAFGGGFAFLAFFLAPAVRRFVAERLRADGSGAGFSITSSCTNTPPW